MLIWLRVGEQYLYTSAPKGSGVSETVRAVKTRRGLDQPAISWPAPGVADCRGVVMQGVVRGWCISRRLGEAGSVLTVVLQNHALGRELVYGRRVHILVVVADAAAGSTGEHVHSRPCMW